MIKFFFLIFLSHQVSTFSSDILNSNKGLINSHFEVSSSTIVNSKIKTIIETFNSSNPSAIEKKKLIANILKLDSLIKHISSDDIKHIVETELFKTYLGKNNSQKNYSLKFLNNGKIEDIKLLLQSDKISVFSKSITSAIITDIELILTNSKFNTFRLLKSRNRKVSSMSREMRRFDRKLSFLIPFVSRLIIMGPEKFSTDIEMKLKVSFQNIINVIYAQVKYSSYFNIQPRLNIASLKYFKINLLGKKNNLKKLQPFELFPTAVKHYITPEQLPKPVSTWQPLNDISEIEKLKSKSIKSTSEEVLPSPVEDWLDNI